MTPEEFVAAMAAIHRYMAERERPIEVKEVPRMWKLSARVVR